jgi:hypothetical protein
MTLAYYTTKLKKFAPNFQNFGIENFTTPVYNVLFQSHPKFYLIISPGDS